MELANSFVGRWIVKIYGLLPFSTKIEINHCFYYCCLALLKIFRVFSHLCGYLECCSNAVLQEIHKHNVSINLFRYSISQFNIVLSIYSPECPPAVDGMERFACPTPDRQGRYRCIDDHVLCDGFIDCPDGEDEERQACMFYKTVSIWQHLCDLLGLFVSYRNIILVRFLDARPSLALLKVIMIWLVAVKYFFYCVHHNPKCVYWAASKNSDNWEFISFTSCCSFA